MPSIPVDLTEAPRRMRATEHPIDLHPARDQLIEVIGLHLLTPRASKPTWRELYLSIMVNLPDGYPLVLGATEDAAVESLRRYAGRVARSITLTGEFMRAALHDSESDLNLLRRKMALADELEAALKAAREAGDLRAVAALGRAAEQALSSFEATAERYDIIPQAVKRVDVRQSTLKVDIKGVLDHAAGRRPQPVRVESDVVRP